MVDFDLVEKLGKYATPTLYEAMPSVVTALAPGIVPLFRPISIRGPAFTVQAAPGDNLAVHLAVAEAPAGSILVVSIGDVRRGFWGEVLMEAALARGLRGLITDGAVRDTPAIRGRGFPVFCAGIAIPGTVKRWPGVLNQPVMIGEVIIHPGDYIVGDDDGVVVVPPEATLEIITQAQARVDKEADLIRRLRHGELTVDLLNLRSAGRKERADG